MPARHCAHGSSMYKQGMTDDGRDAGSGRLPGYVTDMVRRLPPASSAVVPGSTPVVAFGDPATARAATLGINPSRSEFVDGQGRLLDGGQRRLATLGSLGAARLDELTDRQVGEVVADCAAYFGRNPYRLWFDPLDQLLRAAAGASYYDGTACHLDLVQWATDPVWGQISEDRARRALMDDGVPHLRAQLAASPEIGVVLCNGRQVIDQVQAAGLAGLDEAGVIRSGQVTCRLYSGTAGAGAARWIGWSANLQSSWGVSSELKRELAAWVAQTLSEADQITRPPGPPQPVPDSVSASEYLPRGLRVHGKRELAAVLAAWLECSGAATIGDVGSFGRVAWLRISVGGTEVVLNADTKRPAVDAFVRASATDPDRPWLVVASQRGHATKVLPGPDPVPVPGWYAYLARPGTAGQLI